MYAFKIIKQKSVYTCILDLEAEGGFLMSVKVLHTFSCIGHTTHMHTYTEITGILPSVCLNN